ncbi:acyl-CoA dehydrogenase [Herbiconiux sp. 11R-BC]|uniref:acyl-CoA dehydrogenase n=1 Tax=Herbiconiux sp. 11R-BC TaxID=3111637 RepID=UPI003BFF3F9E
MPLSSEAGPRAHDIEALQREAEAVADDVSAALRLAARLTAGDELHNASQSTLHSILAAVAEGSAMAARVVEPHIDALAILAECPDPVDLDAVGADAHSTWGVFAAESGDTRLDAREQNGRWTLDGLKPWCSLADRLSHALVTAHTPEGRRLFAVDLSAGVTAHPEAWVARGLPGVTSGPADFALVPALPVGEAGWYLERPGFEWGGIRVAACWTGAARGIARRVQDAAAHRDTDLLWLHAGRAEAALYTAELALHAAATAIDAPRRESDAEAGRQGDGAPRLVPGGPATQRRTPAQLAQLTRSVVREACESVLREAAHALGPAPAALDPWFAAQTSDLALYLLQDHGDRDLARLGRLSAPSAPRTATTPTTTTSGSSTSTTRSTSNTPATPNTPTTPSVPTTSATPSASSTPSTPSTPSLPNDSSMPNASSGPSRAAGARA